VELHGEAWYVHPDSGMGYYMKNGDKAYNIMRNLSLGISNEDIIKIPVGIEESFQDFDSDSDGLSDKLEEGLGTNINNPDSDNNGNSDKIEIINGFDPLGPGTLIYDQSIINQVKGRIVLQVEDKGQAWYVHPNDGKRYYMKDGEAAYNIMRYFGLGITNLDLANIERTSSGEYSTEYTISKNDINYLTEKLEGADPATFELIDSGMFSNGIKIYSYAKDAYNVYVNDVKIENAYAATFEVIEPAGRGYSKDFNNVYLAIASYTDLTIEKISDSDPTTFEILEKTGFSKDKNNVYHIGQIIQNADPETFEFIGNRYTQDKNYIFFSFSGESNIVENADRDTFEELPEDNNIYAKDKNYVYYMGEILEGEDPETFQP